MENASRSKRVATRYQMSKSSEIHVLKVCIRRGWPVSSGTVDEDDRSVLESFPVPNGI